MTTDKYIHSSSKFRSYCCVRPVVLGGGTYDTKDKGPNTNAETYELNNGDV